MNVGRSRFLVVTAFFGLWWLGMPCASAEQVLDTFCSRERAYRVGVQWFELQAGRALGAYDAILTCDSASVTLRAPRQFDSFLSWEQRGPMLWTATIPESTLLVLAAQAGEQVQLEVQEVRGTAFYTYDRETVRGWRILSAQASRDSRELEKERGAIQAALDQMDWNVLAPGQLLDRWDMVWTGESGRVEIELLQIGPEHRLDPMITVIDTSGYDTQKRRLRSQTVFVMNPRSYVVARVTAIIGEVKLARDKDQVRAFVWKYPEGRAFLGSFDVEEHRRWLEMLRKEHLE